MKLHELHDMKVQIVRKSELDVARVPVKVKLAVGV